MRSPVSARLLLLAMVCLVAAACGGSGDDTGGAAPATTTTTSGTTAAASQACADAAALKASMAELDQLDPAQAGKAGIQAALDKVQANLAALRGSATGQWGSQLTELDGAVQALKTTIAGLDGNSVLSAVPTILSDLKQIDTAWTAFQQQINQALGSASRLQWLWLKVRQNQSCRRAARRARTVGVVDRRRLWSALAPRSAQPSGGPPAVEGQSTGGRRCCPSLLTCRVSR